MKNINDVLVVSLSNIGDVILTLPVVGALRDNFPKANISILVGPRAEEAVSGSPEFSETIIYDKQKSAKAKLLFLKKLRRKNYDLIVDLRHSLFPLFLKSKYHSPFFLKKDVSCEHRCKKHLRSLERLGIKIDNIRFPFYISESAKENISKALGTKINNELIVINPAAASHLKCWGEDRFILLAQKIKELADYSVVITGGEKDKEKCRRIAMEIEGSINLGGKLKFQELAALLKKAKVFITNDSGPLHLASALGVPTVAVFGPSDPKKYGPLSSLNRMVRKELACSPCELAQCPNKSHQCMKLIGAEDVFNAFKEILNEQKQQNS